MNSTIKKYIDPLIKFWSGQTKKTKKILLTALGGIVAVSFIAVALLNRTQYTILYPGLDREEASEIADQLNSRDVDYREKDGTIYVPDDEEAALRMEFSNMGYPKSAMNYDYFTENIDIMSTDYEKKVIEKYQLNQRLEAVIETLEPIKDATVIISIPEDEGYAWDENRKMPSASVAVEIAAGKTLSAEQVTGIKRLVAKSVPDLETEEVVVVDTKTGDELGSTDLSGQTDISKFKLEIEQQYEKDIRSKVLYVLAPIYGEKNVNVAVKAIMDIDKKIQEIVTYEPSQDNSGVLSESNEMHEQTQDGEGTGGVVGTESNSDVTTYPGVAVDDNTLYIKDENSYKYLVSQIKQQIEGDAASVSNMTIAVAINREGLGSDEKEELSRLVASAAAIEPEKVAIYAGEFQGEDGEGAEGDPSGDATGLFSTKMLIIAGAGLALVLIVLVIVLTAIKKRKKKKQNPDAEEKANAAFGFGPNNSPLSEEFVRSLQNAEASKEEMIKQEIQEFSVTNPEISAQLIKSWLKGDDRNG